MAPKGCLVSVKECELFVAAWQGSFGAKLREQEAVGRFGMDN